MAYLMPALRSLGEEVVVHIEPIGKLFEKLNNDVYRL
jgi:hypothetical protein